MSESNPEDSAEIIGQQQDSEIDPAAPDPREPDTQIAEDQEVEIDEG